MQEYINSAVELISSADIYLIAISGVLVALAAVAKLTKTKKDDEAIAKANSFINKLISFYPAKTKVVEENKVSKPVQKVIVRDDSVDKDV